MEYGLMAGPGHRTGSSLPSIELTSRMVAGRDSTSRGRASLFSTNKEEVMKRQFVIGFITAAAVAALLWAAAGLLAAGPPTPRSPQAGAPTVVSYQGQVTVDGAPYTGAPPGGVGYFKFAIFVTRAT